MIHAVWGLCKCECVSHTVSRPSVGMKLLQASQLLINDLYQSWFPSWLSAFQHQMWLPPSPFHCTPAADCGCGFVSHLAFVLAERTHSLQFYEMFTISPSHTVDAKMAASRCATLNSRLNWSCQLEDPSVLKSVIKFTELCTHGWTTTTTGSTFYLGIVT